MKLHAILENSRGKAVSLSDNEQITATVYDGNKRAYSVTIEWCDIGDIFDHDGNDLPESEKTKGAIVTTREWRNQPDDRRKDKKETCNFNACQNKAVYYGVCSKHKKLEQ